jgi:DNA-binding GntR family transcriptional regulator
MPDEPTGPPKRAGSGSLRGLGVGVAIQRHSTAEQTAAVLREAILEGRLTPGTPLRELPLADELNVSRNSIREAFRILEGEYLVPYKMNRGTVVAEFSDEKIERRVRRARVCRTGLPSRAAEAP